VREVIWELRFMNYLIFLFFIFFLFACSPTNPTNQLPEETAMNNWSSSLEEMKQETLDQACDSEMRLFYEKEIERQSKHLNPAQLEKSMENMQEQIVCQ